MSNIAHDSLAQVLMRTFMPKQMPRIVVVVVVGFHCYLHYWWCRNFSSKLENLHKWKDFFMTHEKLKDKELKVENRTYI